MEPKQYARLAGISVLRRTIDVFARHPEISTIGVVIHPDDQAFYESAVAGVGDKLIAPAIGGETRQASVLAGLEALAKRAPDFVLIHDAARPFVTHAVMNRVLSALNDTPAAIAALPVADTLKQAGDDRRVQRTVARQSLWRAQTPQGFQYPLILDLHRRAAAQGIGEMTDDAALAEWGGIPVALVEGAERNRKITTAEDLVMAETIAGGARETRTASGFDVHRFAPGDHVWLGGVRIAHTQRLEGHSDADVALHALTDALLGTIGAGDIGTFFPPSDARWEGAASRIFLEHAAGLIAQRGGRIVNVDVTILAEAPKVGPHRTAMQATIGEVLGIAADRVGIKATTTEGLGFTGRGEGIAAMATATVLLPAEA